MTPPRASHSAFATEQTEHRPAPYSQVLPKVVHQDRGEAPANGELAAAASVFEPKNLFLAALPAADRTLLEGLLSYQRLPQGTILQESEQPVDHVYFIESGMVSLVAAMQDGAAIETVTLGREAILGVLGAFGNHRATARAIVQLDATAWRLSAGDFRRAIEQSPTLRRTALLASELMLAQMQQTAACNALHTAERRLCRWILQVQDRVGEDVIRLTHDFLAHMLAVRRPTVSLIAYELQHAGLIRYQRGRIAILDRPGLERSACECVGVLREKTRRVISEIGF